jgi:hypothetical protein
MLFLIVAAFVCVRAEAPELGSAIIGLAPLLAPLLVEIVMALIKRPPRSTFHSHVWLLGIIWAFGYSAGYLTPTVLINWLSTPTVEIAFERSGPVGRYETTRIQWRRFAEGRSPGLFVYSVESGLYFPQRCGLGVSKAGTQTCRIEIGSDTDSGKHFEIVTASLDQEARQQLDAYWNNPISAGLRILPEGSGRINSSRVYRGIQ